MGIDTVPDNARIVRNMFEASHVGYDHILWFYILNAFDYVNVPDALNAQPTTPALQAVQDQVRRVVESGQLGPFAGHWWDHPGYALEPEQNLELTAHYLQAIEAQQWANDAQAFMGGRFPMVMTYIPGGMQERLEIEEILYYNQQMSKVKDFVDNVMLQDLLMVAPAYMDLAEQGQGVGNYLSWGLFDVESQVPEERILPRGIIANRDIGRVQDADLDQVKLFTRNSFYEDDAGEGKHPLDTSQQPNYTGLPELDAPDYPTGKYDWTTSARYGDQNLPLEVGPLAEILVAYGRRNQYVVDLVDSTLRAIGAEDSRRCSCRTWAGSPGECSRQSST
jgi:[NiFe] hydrogenase large subunit